MHILAIYGSPRRNGNSSLLLERFLAAIQHESGLSSGGHKIERIRLIGDYRPCLGCDACVRGSCIQKDDMQYLYPKLEAADVIVVAAPVYFYGLPAQLKAVVDRCQLFFNRKYVRKEKWRTTPGKGLFISCGATGGEQLFHGAVLTAKYWFDALDFSYSGEALFRNIDTAGAIKDHPTAFRDVERLAESLPYFSGSGSG